MQAVSTRIPEEDEQWLSELEAELGADRAEVLRRLIGEGLAEWRKETAIEQVRDQQITLRKAAELADVSYPEMLSLAAKAGVEIGYTTADLERDLDRV